MRCLLEFVLLKAPKSIKTRQVFGPVFIRKSIEIATMIAVTAFQKITSIPNTQSHGVVQRQWYQWYLA